MDPTRDILSHLWAALGGPPALLSCVAFNGQGGLKSAFPVTEFAAATTATAALALAELVHSQHACEMPAVVIDRRLASLWFMKSVRPIGWKLPPQWDPVAGNYRTRDGWIRLHTNAPHHRRAALQILGVQAEPSLVASAVGEWMAADLESAIVAAGGCAGRLRSRAEWQVHEQGRAVAAEDLVAWSTSASVSAQPIIGRASRPLAGLRVLDLTRVLAGPVATRFLAGFGADVLRIDPPSWDEPAVLPEVTVGKTCARLDLSVDADRTRFECLLREAHVIVHGYRSNALERIGFGRERRAALNPSLIDVSLDAYGWSGPWAHRRGFDTVVQMSTGLAHAEMIAAGSDQPQQLPVQALDYGTGHLLAACVLRALTMMRNKGQIAAARMSLARSAEVLFKFPRGSEGPLFPESDADLSPLVEKTFWGDARRLRVPFSIGKIDMIFDRPAGPLGDSVARFQTSDR